MDASGNIRPLTPERPLEPGEVKLTAQQAATLESIPRAARRAVLAHMKSKNPKKQRKWRNKVIRTSRKKQGK